MPFVSQAQRRKFYADPKLRHLIPEFEAATPKGVKLPQHVKRQKGKPVKRKGGMQPHAKGMPTRPGQPMLAVMMQGRTAHGRHPMDAKRALQKRQRSSALGKALGRRGM